MPTTTVRASLKGAASKGVWRALILERIGISMPGLKDLTHLLREGDVQNQKGQIWGGIGM